MLLFAFAWFISILLQTGGDMLEVLVSFLSQFPPPLPLSVIVNNPHFEVLNNTIAYLGGSFLLLSVLFNWSAAAIWKAFGWPPEKRKEFFTCGLIALGSAITVFVLGLYVFALVPAGIAALFMRDLKA